MILYLFVALWPMVCCFIHRRCSFFSNEKALKKSENIWVAIALFPMFLLVALRSKTMGPDTGTYIEAYKFASNNTFSVLLATQKMEPGFLFIEFIFSKIIPSPYVFQIIYVLFYYFSLSFFLFKNGKNKFLIAFLVCTLGLFKFYFTGIRQCISMCICLLSFESVKRKRPFKFFIIVLIALLFHMSAAFFAPIYFVYHMKHNKKNFIIFSLLGAFFAAGSIFLLPFFSGFLGYGAYGLEFTGNGFVRFGILTLLFLIIFVLPKNRKFIDNYDRGMFNVSLIFIIIWLLRLITRTAERVSLYYLPLYSVFLGSRLERVFGANAKESKISLVVICFALLALFLHSIKADGLIPYATFFSSL